MRLKNICDFLIKLKFYIVKMRRNKKRKEKEKPDYKI